MTLVDGVTPLTPQQLGLMGMEALETVVGYWEDALAAYNASRWATLNLAPFLSALSISGGLVRPLLTKVLLGKLKETFTFG